MILSRRHFTKSALLAGITAIMGLPIKLYAQNAAPESYKFGKFTVWPVTDINSEQNASNFLTDEKTLKQYLPSGKAAAGIQTFLIKNNNQYILVDTGLGNPTVSKLLPTLAAIGCKPADINIVLITHMHGDHIGGLLSDGKKAFPNATVKICKTEYDFWMGSDEHNRQAKAITEAYGKNLDIFPQGSKVAEGITAEEAYGHTPGHTLFRLESDGATLLFAGDFLHGAALQFPHPDINSKYDMDPVKSAALRLRILETASQENIPLAGAHIAAPSIVTTTKTGDKAFSFHYYA